MTYPEHEKQKKVLEQSQPPSGDAEGEKEEMKPIVTWTPVTDTPYPDHGGQVLISFDLNSANRGFVTTARWERGHWDWNSKSANANRRDEDVKAWAPLPDGYLG